MFSILFYTNTPVVVIHTFRCICKPQTKCVLLLLVVIICIKCLIYTDTIVRYTVYTYLPPIIDNRKENKK